MLKQSREVVIYRRGCSKAATLCVGSPKQYIKAKVIFITKTGSRNYTDIKNFSLKRLVDRKAGSLRLWASHEEQQTHQAGKSIQTSLQSVTGFIESQLKRNSVCRCVSGCGGCFQSHLQTCYPESIGRTEYTREHHTVDHDGSVRKTVSERCRLGEVKSPLLW